MQPLGQGCPPRRLDIVLKANAALAAADREGRSLVDAAHKFLAELEAEGNKLSLSTLYNWMRAYRINGVAGLADHRQRQAKPHPDREFLSALRALYELPSMLDMEAVYLLACREARRRGWRMCTFRQAKRYIRREVLPAIRKGAEPFIDPSSKDV